MGPHDVHDDLPAKLGEIVRSYDRVLIPRQYVVQPCLVLHEIINAWAVFQSPFHVGDEASQRESLLSTELEDLLDHHPLQRIVGERKTTGVQPDVDVGAEDHISRDHVVTQSPIT